MRWPCVSAVEPQPCSTGAAERHRVADRALLKQPQSTDFFPTAVVSKSICEAADRWNRPDGGLIRHIDTTGACCQIGGMMRTRQGRFASLRAALMLLAAIALVVSRSVSATAGFDTPAMVALMAPDCPGHATPAHSPGHHHDTAHHHPSLSAEQVSAAAEPNAAGETSRDVPAHPGHMPCCVAAAALVVPVSGDIPLPVFALAGAYDQVPVAALDGRTPEGPSEPPRTSDQS